MQQEDEEIYEEQYEEPNEEFYDQNEQY